MDLNITGRVAVVLGATGGLGRAIVATLAAEGVRVAAVARNPELLAKLATEVPGIHTYCWNLGEIEQVADVFARIVAELGPVDILVNNTGGPPPGAARGIPVDQWTSQFQLMVGSVIAATDQVVESMRTRGWGRIITLTSSGVITPIANLAMSNTLRMSLLGWSKTLSREVAGDRVTVNIVVPGRIDTARVRSLDENKAQREGRSADDVAAESRSNIPAGRYGRPEEFADAVTFLASERARYITGTILRVDGGLIPSI